MVRRHDDEIAMSGVSLQKALEQIDALAIEYAVGFIEQQQAWLQELPFGDR